MKAGCRRTAAMAPMARIARAWAAGALLGAAIQISSCIQGSETGNPTKGLSGIILDRDGKPAAAARVRLVPAGYIPLDDEAAAALPIARTDARGRFRVAGIPAGRYNLEAMNPADGTRSRLAGIDAAEGSREVPVQKLAPPGSIAATLAGAADTVAGFVYVPGSTYRVPVRASSSVVRLDSLAPGPVDSLVYGSAAPGSPPARAFAWDLEVDPDSVSRASGPYLAWRRSVPLTLDAGPAGAGIGADLTGFPLRIALPDSLAAAARAGGSELRASNQHGAPLPCEAQKGANGAPAALWVRVDTVFAGKPTRLRLFWDYAGTDSLPAPGAGTVFPPADGYAGAWHLDEDPAANGGRLADASGRGNEGLAVGYASAGGAVAGIAGGGLKLDGKAQYMGTRMQFDDPETFTLLIWFRADKSAGGRLLEFADKDTSHTNYWDRLLHLYGDGTLHFGIYPPDTAGRPMPTRSTYKILGFGDPLDDGAWHQAAARLSPQGGQALFIDGVRVANDPGSRSAQIIQGYWRLGYGQLSGWGPGGTGEYFQGVLDEFWAVHAALSDDFVRLSYQNLKPGSRLILWP